MNKTMLKTAMGSSALAALCLGASSAQAATASATSRAKVQSPLAITNTSDLNFGTIITDGTLSGVILDPTDGSVICGSGLICGGTPTRAHFDLAGSNLLVTISQPTAVSLTGPGTAMLVSFIRSANTVAMVQNLGTFEIGGVLTVNAAQADGDYAASFTQVADYQ
jgi:Domain of unknown function (DUF4402)